MRLLFKQTIALFNVILLCSCRTQAPSKDDLLDRINESGFALVYNTKELSLINEEAQKYCSENNIAEFTIANVLAYKLNKEYAFLFSFTKDIDSRYFLQYSLSRSEKSWQAFCTKEYSFVTNSLTLIKKINYSFVVGIGDGDFSTSIINEGTL